MKPKIPKWTPLAYKWETKQRVKKRVLRQAQIEWFRCRIERNIFKALVNGFRVSYTSETAPKWVVDHIIEICDESVRRGVLQPNWGEYFLNEVTEV